MEQLTIYEELGIVDDPIYTLILNLKVNGAIQINGYNIEKNILGLFEISNEDIHECFSSDNLCYKKITSLINGL